MAGILWAGRTTSGIGRGTGEGEGPASSPTEAFVVTAGAEIARVRQEPRGDAIEADGDVDVRLRDGSLASLGVGTRMLVAFAGSGAAEGGEAGPVDPGDVDHRETGRVGTGRVDVERGHVSFELGARRSSLLVVAGGIEIIDRGTSYTVDVAGAGAAVRVLVTVTEGSVSAGGVELLAGRGVAFLDGRAVGAPWPLDAKPTLSLESEVASPAGGEPVVLRIVLSNPTDGWIPWPSRGAESPIHVEIVPPAGAPSLVRVTDAMIEGPAAGGRAIPPRGRDVLRVRFDRAFASAGAYRLRAIFRPAAAVESPTSDSITLVVRATGGTR